MLALAATFVFTGIGYAQQTAPVNAHPASRSSLSATSGDDADVTAAEQCTALKNVDLSGIQDAPTQITAARLIETKGDPIYCQVQGYVSPQVGFEIRLPANNWNGKFMETGCAGGRLGMVEAQRFPWDFDGIIAGAPAQSAAIMVRFWAALAMKANDGASILSHADLQLVHNAVVAACDMNDGVRDGLIGDPRT